MIGDNKRLIDVFGDMSDFFQAPEDALYVDAQERFWVTKENDKFFIVAIVAQQNTDHDSMIVAKKKLDEATLRTYIRNVESFPPAVRRVAVNERVWLDAIITCKQHHHVPAEAAPDLPEWSIGSP